MWRNYKYHRKIPADEDHRNTEEEADAYEEEKSIPVPQRCMMWRNYKYHRKIPADGDHRNTEEEADACEEEKSTPAPQRSLRRRERPEGGVVVLCILW